MKLKSYIPTIAKAVAAYVTPVLLFWLARLTESTGVDIPFDPTNTEATVTGVITALVVWATRNRD